MDIEESTFFSEFFFFWKSYYSEVLVSLSVETFEVALHKWILI